MIDAEAGDEDDGRRLDAVAARLSGSARVLVQQAVRAGDIEVNGSREKPSYRVRAGDRITGSVTETAPAPPRPEAIPVTVRLEDQWLAVVSKPAGLVVHAGAGTSEATLVNALLGRGMTLAGGDAGRPGIVHRLDKDTSGLLIVAKQAEAHRVLGAAMKERRIKRHYVALVRGVLPSETGTIDAPIARNPARRRSMAVVPGGRPAVTHYEAVATGAGATLVHVRLETGRTHQIRVHFAHLGHPVVGDRTYGGKGEIARRAGLERPFLHAFRLEFPHPFRDEEVAVQDALPDELSAALDALGLGRGGRALLSSFPR